METRGTGYLACKPGQWGQTDLPLRLAAQEHLTGRLAGSLGALLIDFPVAAVRGVCELAWRSVSVQWGTGGQCHEPSARAASPTPHTLHASPLHARFCTTSSLPTSDREWEHLQEHLPGSPAREMLSVV